MRTDTHSLKLNWVSTLVFGVLCTLLSGCGDASKAAGRQPAQVRVGYFANLTHAQALIGVSRGDFQKALGAVPLKTAVFNAGPAAIEALFAGELDFAYIGPGPAVNAFIKSQGEGLRVISGSAANGVVIVARKDSGIKTLADLKGKRLATPQHGNTQDISARHFLKETLKDTPADEGGTTTIQAVLNAEQLGLFKDGQLDAAWAPEPWGTRLIHDTGAVLLEEEKNLWPQKRFSITLLVVSKEFIDAYPATVEKFLGVHQALTELLNKSPDEAGLLVNAELKHLAGKALPPDVLKEAMSRIEFGTDPLESSVFQFADWAHELGFAKQQFDLKGLVDLSLLKKIQASKKN